MPSYRILCTHRDCGQSATFKIAACWSDGVTGELKTYALSCPDCLALHADLVLLAAAMPDAALPARPRDYTLSEADAARLRPVGWRPSGPRAMPSPGRSPWG